MSHWQTRTLKEVWESKGFNPTQLAAQANISTQTLYRMNRKDATVRTQNIVRVCTILDITPEYYKSLVAEE